MNRIRHFLAKSFATWVIKRQEKCLQNSVENQREILKHLISQAANTKFGKLHHFKIIKNYQDFKTHVPIHTYENLVPYISAIKEKGEKNVLWPGLPSYLAKTAGTTSGEKYIPLTAGSIKQQVNSAKNALLYYIHETGQCKFLEKKMMFLSGSPQLEHTKSGIPIGRLSGIVNYHIPSYFKYYHMPSYAINCIADWETKMQHIVKETLQADIGLISGIPPWLQMYFDYLYAEKGCTIQEIFPNLSLLVHGGVQFGPYKKKIYETLGKNIPSIETYPASEGFIAFQNSQQEPGLLLQTNSNIFFEFIPTQSPEKRLWLDEVAVGEEYALVLSTNAGLWAYSLGDTIRFVSLNPPKIVVTGRLQHFISAFGEHVIVEEVEKAMQNTLQDYPEVTIIDFTVAPWVSTVKNQPSCHEWLIAFEHPPKNLAMFAATLDKYLCQLNSYYYDLIAGKVLAKLKITPLKPHAFKAIRELTCKIGEQHKVIRLANDRKLADLLLNYHI